MNTTSIEINVLGPLQTRCGTGLAQLSGTKMRSILALLAYRAGDTVRRDELVEELALDRSTGDPVNALHANMTRLRKWIQFHSPDDRVLETVGSGYRLNIERSAVDAHRFATRVENALNLAPAAPSVVAAVLDDALALWRGDALLDVFDGPLLCSIADELHRLRAASREELVHAWIELGRHQKAIVNAKRFLVDDPLNERLHSALVVALRRIGRHAEAVESYQSAERILRDELGIPPSTGLRASLHDRATVMAP
ncbi:AfsR/SARP family transcriptional regulator [Nocardia aurantia]|uniref:Transcriptional regulatory protein EmbR n=1 Tax=Nocardia aurantia TaxID=2585199 RepID=A0A7K0DL23_9NOCA|nr:BTAD domain-containing putative transcriptional regulator [Nocardia aurantia]MQY26389.1 Transcriptional regulatory protein EmbR [Nocardia aurantia]